MKKTIVFAIVLALVFAIAAPAFAAGEAFTTTFETNNEAGRKFKLDGKKVETLPEDLLVAVVTYAGDAAFSGKLEISYPAELTYVGSVYNAEGLDMGMAAINDKEAGKVTFAFAHSGALEAGEIAAVAFTYDADAMAGKTVKVDVACTELLDENAAALENKCEGAEYTFKAAEPIESEDPKPTDDGNDDPKPTDDGNDEPKPNESEDTEEPTTPGKTGAASLAAVAVISVVAGLGAIALRKE